MTQNRVTFEVKPEKPVDVTFLVHPEGILLVDPPKGLFTQGNIPDERLKRLCLQICEACNRTPFNVEWFMAFPKERKATQAHGWRLRSQNPAVAPSLENIKEPEWFRLSLEEAREIFGDAWPKGA